jgi:ATP-dependent 26S proteasome regulatory subunit
LKGGQAGAPENNDYLYFFHDWLGNKGEYLGIQYSDIGEENKKKSESYFWTEEALKLKDEIAFWKNNSNWFNERGIVHRQGALLTGGPGTGKTQMVLQIAKTLSIPVKKINISNMSDQEFQNAYNRGPEKCMIILLEDIDCVMDLRINTLAEKSKTKNLLSFDTLLNTIGGIKRNDGFFLIVTVNDFSKCDPALIRPGRCDIKLEIGPLCDDGRKFIAQNILRDWPNIIDEVVAQTSGKTAAETEHYCIELAIDKFYSEKNRLT